MTTSFSELGLLPSLQLTLEARGFGTLTDIQARALPAMLSRQSVVAIAETGSGKTLTYVLPILERLKRMEMDGNRVEDEHEPRALVIVPTRELGEQVAVVFKTFTHDTRIRVRAVLGGQKMKQNRETVAGVFEVLVATPGRLDKLVATQQLALFSATMSPAVQELATRMFRDAAVIESAGRQKVVPSLQTRHVDVPDGLRFEALQRILTEQTTGGTMLFANTRAQCDGLAMRLRDAGWTCVVHRGDMDAVERRRNLKAFRAGEIQLLLSTDLGARGLDIDVVDRVINVHLPRQLDEYLHRVGRTARAGRHGLVINLVTPRDAPLLAQLGDGKVAPAPVRITQPGGRSRR